MPSLRPLSSTSAGAALPSGGLIVFLVLMLAGACRRESPAVPSFGARGAITSTVRPPLTEDEALELTFTLSEAAVRQDVNNLDLATQQTVGRCAAAIGAASSKGTLGQPYSDPEKFGGITDPLRNVGGRYGNGLLPTSEDRDRVYRFAYELGRRKVSEERCKTAALLFAARLFGRGTQPPPPRSSKWNVDQRSMSAVDTKDKPGSNFVQLHLPRGVTVELPKNWTTLSDNQRITIDSSVEARQTLAGTERPESSLPFAANYNDDAGNVAGIFNVRFYPEYETTQADVRKATREEMAELDSAGREMTEKSQAQMGVKLLEWKGTRTQFLNGVLAVVAEYRRSGSRAGTSFCVRLVKVMNASRSFTVTISFREDMEVLLRPICDRIIQSIRQ